MGTILILKGIQNSRSQDKNLGTMSFNFKKLTFVGL